MANFFSRHSHIKVFNFTRSISELIATAIVFVFCLSGCIPLGKMSSKTRKEFTITKDANTRNKKVILTTFTILADMARNVAGEKSLIESLVKPGSEIHGYEPTPSDIVRAKSADLILDNGLGLERWVEKFYSNLKHVPHITLSKGIMPINIIDKTYGGQTNPHAWMSPKLALKYVENIRDALISLDPDNTETYTANALAYGEKIKQIDQKLRRTVEKIPVNRRFIVTCEGAFSYLARDYGLKEVYLWAVNSEKLATPQQLKKVIRIVQDNHIPAIFCESTVSADVQKQVAKESNTKFGGVFYVDSLTGVNGAAPTYYRLIDYNINAFSNGFKKSKN